MWIREHRLLLYRLQLTVQKPVAHKQTHPQLHQKSFHMDFILKQSLNITYEHIFNIFLHLHMNQSLFTMTEIMLVF